MTRSIMFPECIRKIARFIIPPAFWLGVWQFAAMAVAMELTLPTPLFVAWALSEPVVQPLFWPSPSCPLYTPPTPRD